MAVRTDDRAPVRVAYNDVVCVMRENFERMAGGAVLTSADMYFITAPTFQTAHEKYAGGATSTSLRPGDAAALAPASRCSNR